MRPSWARFFWRTDASQARPIFTRTRPLDLWEKERSQLRSSAFTPSNWSIFPKPMITFTSLEQVMTCWWLGERLHSRSTIAKLVHRIWCSFVWASLEKDKVIRANVQRLQSRYASIWECMRMLTHGEFFFVGNWSHGIVERFLRIWIGTSSGVHPYRILIGFRYLC